MYIQDEWDKPKFYKKLAKSLYYALKRSTSESLNQYFVFVVIEVSPSYSVNIKNHHRISERWEYTLKTSTKVSKKFTKKRFSMHISKRPFINSHQPTAQKFVHWAATPPHIVQRRDQWSIMSARSTSILICHNCYEYIPAVSTIQILKFRTLIQGWNLTIMLLSTRKIQLEQLVKQIIIESWSGETHTSSCQNILPTFTT